MVFSRLKVDILFSRLRVKRCVSAGIKNTWMVLCREGPRFAGIEIGQIT